MPNGNTHMSLGDRIIQNHGHDVYRRFMTQHTPPEDGSDRPHFPQYAVVTCSDCGNARHHEFMNFFSSYAHRYHVRIGDRFDITSNPVLYGARERVLDSVCPSCVDTCDWCNDDTVVRLSHRHHDDMTLCSSCEDDVRVCAGCDEVMNAGSFNPRIYQFDNRDDEYYCRSCYQDCQTSCGRCGEHYHCDDEPSCDCNNGSHLILGYSAMRSDDDRIFYVGVKSDGSVNRIRTQWQFRSSSYATEPVMGFECETESEGASVYDGAMFFDTVINEQRLYLKEDASIHDGFEIVTHPHTLDMFQNHFDWEPFKQLSQLGFRSYKFHKPDRYGNVHDIGFHVHINRASFYTKGLHEDTNSSPHLYGFLSFIYHNVDAMTRISSRNSSDYASITANELDNVYAYARHRSSGRRNVAVNLNNQHTVELRCFQGALNPDRALGYLEFVHGLWAYTKGDRISKLKDTKKFSFNAFADWVEKDPKYSNLVSLINRSDARNV